MKVDIIGAGIGGLTTAIALQEKGFEIRIFEQAEVLKPIGAGIILANNAMQVYDKLGLKKEIEQAGIPISVMNITKENLNKISSANLAYFEQKNNVKSIAIHRGLLQSILLKKLNNSELHLNHKLISIKTGDTNSILKFENGKTVVSDLTIGADGIYSKTRTLIFPSYQIRQAKQICWRGIVDSDLPNTFKNELNEAWGKNSRFGFTQISNDQIYWYALVGYNKNKHELLNKSIDSYFNSYHPLIKDTILKTPKKI